MYLKRPFLMFLQYLSEHTPNTHYLVFLGIVKLIKAMPMPDTTMPQVLSADGTLKDQVSMMSSCSVFLIYIFTASFSDPVIDPM